MAPPAPRRPAPGGGLAILVVVTILAALAAPHATAVRGLVAGGLPVAAADRHRIRVSCLRSGHSWYVKGTRRVSNHSVWRAVDLDRVDGRPVSYANAAARRLTLWIGRGGAGVQPSEVGSPWAFGGRPWFTDAGHQGHLHVGFGGPTQPGEAR